MPRLPAVSWDEVVRVLEHVGYEQARQRGSHIIMVRKEPPLSTI